MYNCDIEGVSRRKSEKKGKTVWPSSRPFSTWPHRKLANEISPRKAIGLQIFNSRSPNANCNEEKPLQSAAAGDRGKVESKRKEERRLSQSSSIRLLQTGLCSAPLFPPAISRLDSAWVCRRLVRRRIQKHSGISIYQRPWEVQAGAPSHSEREKPQ